MFLVAEYKGGEEGEEQLKRKKKPSIYLHTIAHTFCWEKGPLSCLAQEPGTE